MDLLTKIESPYGNGDLYGYEIPKHTESRGFILFVHGFHSSSNIWSSGPNNSGLAELFLHNNFNCYAINFSTSTTGSMSTLADYELAGAFHWIIERNPSEKCVIIAHSMGGLISRYFLDKDEKHPLHNPNQIAQNGNILSVALLATPNHGVAILKTKYKPATNNCNPDLTSLNKDSNDHSQNDESDIRIKIKDILSSSRSKGTKKLNELIKTSPLELRADSFIIRALNDHLSANLWPQLRWINIIGDLDLVVDDESAAFTQEEVKFLNDFHQNHFNVTHMRNPFAWLSPYLSKYYNKVDINNIEKLIPKSAYLTKSPIYGDKHVQKYLLDLILPLFM